MITENISQIYKKISRASMKSERDPFEVNLIGVTKTVPVELITEAADAGIRLFGESRVQEAEEKIASFAPIALKEGFSGVQWHFIGHLQRNKARQAVRLFDMIHSLDSLELAWELNKEASKIGKIQQALIQLKLSEEETKHGLPESCLFDLLKAVSSMDNLSVLGLMTIPPLFEKPESSRPYFQKLASLRERAQREGFNLPYLSMGMSSDYEIAIEEGATFIRVGTAIFGQR